MISSLLAAHNIVSLFTSSMKIYAGIVLSDRLGRIMQLLQALFLILCLVSVARFWKTEDVKLIVLAFFFLCMGTV